MRAGIAPRSRLLAEKQRALRMKGKVHSFKPCKQGRMNRLVVKVAVQIAAGIAKSVK